MKFIVIISLLVTVVFAADPTTQGVPGGRMDVDPNTETVQDVVRFAYTMIHDSLNSANAIKLGKVIKAQSQVVSGIKYFLTIEVEETDCKRDVEDMSNCKTIKTEVCEAVVLFKSWDTLHPKQLISYSCN